MKLVLGPLVRMVLANGIGVLFLAFTVMLMPQDCDAAGSTVVKSIYVNWNGRANFTSIQDAIDSVPFGNDQWIRVHVAAGVYK